MPKEFKIAFCIVCMNRLHQLKETIFSNITDNESYQNLQFILLDYNSGDGMGAWVKENLHDHIARERLIYYRTDEPVSFSHSHSKNLAFKLSEADIVCNVNADHFCGRGFANYTNEKFNEDENIVLSTIDFHKTKPDYIPFKDVFGKVCVRKNDFLRVKGFDERMNRYGFEDWDFINRLEMIDLKRVLIDDYSYLSFISHTEEERYSLSLAHIHEVYIRYTTPSASEIIIMYANGRFEKGTLIDNATEGCDQYINAFQKKDPRFQYSIKDPGWQEGNWERSPNGNTVFVPDQAHGFFLVNLRNDDLSILQDPNTGLMFYKLTKSADIESIIRFVYFFYNRSLMEKNLASQTPVVNELDFGVATVFKNFQFNKPIHI